MTSPAAADQTAARRRFAKAPPNRSRFEMAAALQCEACKGKGEQWLADPGGGSCPQTGMPFGSWEQCGHCRGTGHRLCDDCDENPATETWDYSDAPIPVRFIPAPDHLCESCADKRRDRYLERRAQG